MLDETGLPASKFFETDGIGYVSVSFLRKFMAMSKWANDMHPIEPIIIICFVKNLLRHSIAFDIQPFNGRNGSTALNHPIRPM